MTADEVERRNAKMWSTDADAKALQILREHAADLYQESEREAHRAGADSVAPGYVEKAAHTVRIRRTTTGPADVLLSVGTALLGLGGGALLALAAAGNTDAIDDWVSWTAVGLLLVGAVMSAIGGTTKWERR